jgi:hypothetical protein
MTINKRGLGRGLEALLGNVIPQEAQHLQYPPINEALENNNNFSRDTLISIDKDHRPTEYSTDLKDSPIALEALDDKSFINNAFKSIHQEKVNLLFEAEALIKLIDEFEIIAHRL